MQIIFICMSIVKFWIYVSSIKELDGIINGGSWHDAPEKIINYTGKCCESEGGIRISGI